MRHDASVSPAVSRFALTLWLLAAAGLGFSAGAIISLTDGDDARTTTASSASPSAPAGVPSASTSTAAAGAAVVRLQADTSAVPAGGQINLAGAVEPAAEGVVLRVQRSRDGGEWQDFGVTPVTTTTKGDGTFGTYVQTSQTGAMSWRVVGSVEGVEVVSDEVAVTVG